MEVEALSLDERPLTPISPKRIWIDLDNTPHVPFFHPIIRELERAGHTVVVTARDAFQVCSLADRHGLAYTTVGRHYGANKGLKVAGTVWRAAQLLPLIAARKARHLDVARVAPASHRVRAARHPQHAPVRLRARDEDSARAPRARRGARVDRRRGAGEGLPLRRAVVCRPQGGRLRGRIPSRPVHPGGARRRPGGAPRHHPSAGHRGPLPQPRGRGAVCRSGRDARRRRRAFGWSSCPGPPARSASSSCGRGRAGARSGRSSSPSARSTASTWCGTPTSSSAEAAP